MSGRHSPSLVASCGTMGAVLGELEVVQSGQLFREVGRDRYALVRSALRDELSESSRGPCNEPFALDSRLGHDSSSGAICAKTTRM